MAIILITGGTGLIGRNLIPKLLNNGHEIRVLSRSKSELSNIKVFTWNIESEKIEKGALEGVDHIIHLAGYNVSEGRWNNRRKKLIADSRIKSAQLILKKLGDQKIQSFISASGVSIYGTQTSQEIFTEKSEILIEDNDFLGHISVEWEKAADLFSTNANRVIKMRTPVVLGDEGALPRISKPIKMGFGAGLGSGKQWMPWVHINDLTEAYVLAIDNRELDGAFNISAAEHVNNKDFTLACAKALGKKIWLPNVPGFLLKLAFGQMANIILKGSRVNGEKIKEHGFNYQFPKLNEALKDLLNN